MAFDVRLAGLEQETFLGLAADLVTNEGRRDPCERPGGRPGRESAVPGSEGGDDR